MSNTYRYIFYRIIKFFLQNNKVENTNLVDEWRESPLSLIPGLYSV